MNCSKSYEMVCTVCTGKAIICTHSSDYVGRWHWLSGQRYTWRPGRACMSQPRKCRLLPLNASKFFGRRLWFVHVCTDINDRHSFSGILIRSKDEIRSKRMQTCVCGACRLMMARRTFDRHKLIRTDRARFRSCPDKQTTIDLTIKTCSLNCCRFN